MTDQIYCVQFIEFDIEDDLVFQPIHCKNKAKVLTCIQNNFISHMKEYKKLYAINDEELLEIIYEIKLATDLKQIKQLVRQHAIDDDEILFGWCVYEYSKETIAKLLEADADAEQAN